MKQFENLVKQSEKISNRFFFIFALVGTFPIGVYALYIMIFPNDYRNRGLCELTQDLKATSIHGVITKKYEDPDHHMNETINVADQKIVLGLDKSGFYGFINVKDSISKDSGSLDIIVYKKYGDPKIFKIDFGCKE